LALGASTPCKRIRCSPGLGTRAARRGMNSSGDMTRCVVPSPVAPRSLELEHHLPGGVGLHAFVGKGRPGDVAAPLFQRLPLIGGATHGGVQAEAVDVGAKMLLEVRIPGHGGLYRQHLLASTRASSESPSLSAM
jgi:hypothetical protein